MLWPTTDNAAYHISHPPPDPHPGNLIRTPDGRLAILDFGLMTTVDDDIKVSRRLLTNTCNGLPSAAY